MSRYLKRTVLATALAGLLLAGTTSACELDGMSHGYGPMSALFAGAHRYQSLNGFDDEPPPEPVAAVVADTPAEPVAASPPAPRRSFAGWAKAKPPTPGSAEAPASWVPRETRRSSDPASAAPERPESDQGEQGQRPPSGGPVP